MSATLVNGVGRVGQVKEDETSVAASIARLSANNVGEVGCRVGKDVVRTSKGKVGLIVPVRGKIGGGVEGDRAIAVVNVQKLFSVRIFGLSKSVRFLTFFKSKIWIP